MVKNSPANKEMERHKFDPLVGKIPCRRAWQSTPVFLPGESQWIENLAGYSPWDRKELDITEVTEHTHTQNNHLLRWRTAPRRAQGQGIKSSVLDDSR